MPAFLHNGHDSAHPMRENAGHTLARGGVGHQTVSQCAPAAIFPGKTSPYSSVLLIGQTVLTHRMLTIIRECPETGNIALSSQFCKDLQWLSGMWPAATGCP